MPNEENQQIPQPIEDRAVPEEEIQINTSIEQNIIKKIADAKNILIALSSDPSVDELSAAIGLSIYIDRMGKKATAIYSGSTPNALEFLEPDSKFVDSADILQDFVVAINKDKADHLRYKPDGDYVKIFITPYASKITEEDLEFSYGDYNVDLVIALDVANGIDLDAALREYGRIMHDASIINITTGKPGKFGEIEWSEPRLSSVSEILANLVYAMNDQYQVEKDEATAFLTGIVAATDRFSNARTTSATMLMASKLMKSGANEQLIAKNVTPEVDNEMFTASIKEETAAEPVAEESIDLPKEEEVEAPDESLEAAKKALSGAGAEAVQEEEQILKIDDNSNLDEAAAEVMNATYTDIPEATTPVAAPKFDASLNEPFGENNSEASVDIPEEGVKIEASENVVPKPEKVIAPSADFSVGELSASEPNKYSEMMADALNEETVNPASAMTPAAPAPTDEVVVPEIDYSVPGMPAPAPAPMPEMPASAPAPAPMPEMPAPMPMPAAPVPAPEMPAPMPAPIQPAAPAPAPEPTQSEALGAQPVMQDQVYGPVSNDPGAFHIPGM